MKLETIGHIEPLAAAADRPRFSVMIPTYQASLELCETLASVLAQEIDLKSIQIAVVDDGSPTVDVEEIVRRIDPNLSVVEIHKSPTRHGLAGNWNRAINLARGQYVHLLHQDDFVIPGFYRSLERGFLSSSSIGMSFCRTRYIDGNGHLLRRATGELWKAGRIPNWLDRISVRQRVQTPSVLVRRDVYETLGGYRSDLRFALDWEMWVRIAAHYAVWYDPKVLAIYRRHAGNETARLAKIGVTWSDLLDTIQIIRSYLPPEKAETITEKSLRWHTHSAIRSAKRLLAQGEIDGCHGCLNAANRFCEYSNRIAVRTKLKLAVLTAIVNKQTFRKSA